MTQDEARNVQKRAVVRDRLGMLGRVIGLPYLVDGEYVAMVRWSEAVRRVEFPTALAALEVLPQETRIPWETKPFEEFKQDLRKNPGGRPCMNAPAPFAGENGLCGCGNKAYARGHCRSCYSRALYHGLLDGCAPLLRKPGSRRKRMPIADAVSPVQARYDDPAHW